MADVCGAAELQGGERESAKAEAEEAAGVELDGTGVVVRGRLGGGREAYRGRLLVGVGTFGKRAEGYLVAVWFGRIERGSAAGGM